MIRGAKPVGRVDQAVLWKGDRRTAIRVERRQVFTTGLESAATSALR